MDKFFIQEDVVSGHQLLFERNGDFIEESDADLLIAEVRSKEYATILSALLNEHLG